MLSTTIWCKQSQGHSYGPCDLRAKSLAEKFNKFKGPMQRCNIGFKCQNENISKLEQLLKESRIMFKIFWNNVKKEKLLYMQRQTCVHVYHLFETFKHIFCLLYCYAFNISKLKNVSYFLFTIILHVLHFSFQEIVRLRYGQCCIGGCFRDFSKNSRCRVSCAEIQSVRQGHW